LIGKDGKRSLRLTKAALFVPENIRSTVAPRLEIRDGDVPG
jgi:hypothetical protein